VRVKQRLPPALLGFAADGVYRHADAGIVQGGTYRYRINNNDAPDIAIGRIPALDSANVTHYVSKLNAYNSAARGPARRWWWPTIPTRRATSPPIARQWRRRCARGFTATPIWQVALWPISC
jgi:hypothetical protein